MPSSKLFPLKRELPPEIAKALRQLDAGVEQLRAAGKKHELNLKFTLDGRLIGDIGEILAATELEITIQSNQNTGYDGTDRQGRRVEIKTTRLNSFAFRKIAERVICIKLHGSTHWEIIFDGAGNQIANQIPPEAFRNGSRKITRESPASLTSQRQLSIHRFSSFSND